MVVVVLSIDVVVLSVDVVVLEVVVDVVDVVEVVVVGGGFSNVGRQSSPRAPMP